MYATDILADPADAFAFAWSAPMRELAARVGISDVGLRKLLRERGIVIPPQGHWNRVHAGRQVVAPPSPSPRKPGGSGRIRLDARFRDVIPNVGRWPVDGPFASAAVPEALDDLRAQILASTPKVAVPRLAARPYQGLAALLRGEIAREAKHSASGWQWDAPRFASPFWLRQLRLYNALYHGLDRHEAGGALSDHDGELHARVRVCDTVLSLTLVPLARHRRKRVAGHERPADDLPASTPLRLTIGSGDDAPVYEDAVDNRLEVQLRAIVADVVVAGEAAFRRGLREQRDWDLQMARLREEERQRRLAIEEAARARHLAEQAAALREADDIRALVARVRASSANADPAKLATWCDWAQTRADRLDPVLSGKLIAGLDDPAS